MMAQCVDRSCIPVVLLLFVIVIPQLTNAQHLARNNIISTNIETIRILSSIRNQSLLSISRSTGLFIEVLGSGLIEEVPLLWSTNNTCCDTKNSLEIISISDDGHRAIYKFNQLPDFEVIKVYFCRKTVSNRDEQWINLGNDFTVKLSSPSEHVWNKRVKRAVVESKNVPKVKGIRVEEAVKDIEYNDHGMPKILTGKATIRLFGNGFSDTTMVAFTTQEKKFGEPCEGIIQETKEKVESVHNSTTALVKVFFPLKETPFYICVSNNSSDFAFIHQGSETWKAIETWQKTLPLWLTIIIIVGCLSFSALFSGLNLGLMSMDRTELKILCNTGTEKEKQYARTIQPVRNHGNYLLCSILFSNVLVNSIFTILLDDLTSGLVAIICSTLAIVVIGEISPQAICSRHGLCIGAKTIWVTKVTMIITYPLSYPISKLLDVLLGEEIGNVYNRERLKELVKVTTEYNDLEKDEVNIISGALELRKKTVTDVMTRIEDVYMLSDDAILDFETVSDIMKSGYSRIPVYEGTRTNIVTMLYIKDLAFVDPDVNTPLKTLCQFYQNPCNFVYEDVTLDKMFREFKEGQKGHMAFVRRVNNEGEGDPFYEVTGLVTLEDVIEELIQAEIMDETDVFTDNRTKRKRQLRPTKMQDFTSFAEKKENQRIHISPQLTLAMYQYLSATVDAFKPDTISEITLRRLLKHDIIYHIKIKSREKAKNEAAAIIYQEGKAVDYFVLILEGRVEVVVGKENLVFESGPFTYFGTQALTTNIGLAESPTNANPQTLGSIQSINLDSMLRHTFIPDYTVRAVTEVFYVKIKRSLYLAAKKATLLERSQKDSVPSQEQFDDEVEKLLHSLDEDDRSAPESPILPKDKDKQVERERDANQSPVRSVTAPTSPLPVSASPITNSKFIPSHSDHNGKLKHSPQQIRPGGWTTETQSKLDLEAEILARKAEAARILSNKKLIEEEERINLLSKGDNS